MAWLIAFVALILVLLGYILLAPFFLEIDSRSGLLQVRWHRLAKVRLNASDSSLVLQIRIAWWSKDIDLLSPRTKKNKRKTVVKKTPKKLSIQKAKAMLASFKINKLNVTLSFDNMPLNGILYPLALLLARKTGRNISINFWGENEVVVEIENNLFRMMRAYLTTKHN